MGYYDIGSPRGNDQHPGSPDYDDRRADAVADGALDGCASLRHAPCELLRALADFLRAGDEAAARELLMPLYAEKQSPALRALHAEFSRSDLAKDVADLALQREYV